MTDWSASAQASWDGCVAHAERLLVGLDFDGTLSPMVDDPTQAYIHPDAPDALVALAPRVGVLAIVTGRPARQAVELGGLDGVADRLEEAAGSGEPPELVVFGQYGNERWSSRTREVASPEPPEGLIAFREQLPELLEDAGASEAWIEDKGIALAVHTRRLADAQEAYDRLRKPVTRAAEQHGLSVEPGKLVLEVRAEGMNKGEGVRELVSTYGGEAVLFAGDDLGDVEAFRAVRALREAGEVAGLLVCSGDEAPELVDLADVVVDGPDDVIDLLRRLAAALGA